MQLLHIMYKAILLTDFCLSTCMKLNRILLSTFSFLRTYLQLVAMQVVQRFILL